ncbi:hypothetical protein STEG23_024360 [Scotinomys teguina]
MGTPRPCAAPDVQLFENRRKMRCRRASGVTDGCGRPRGGDMAARSKHSAQSMFQIPEFEPSEQEDSSTVDRGLGPSLPGDQPGPYLAPGLLGNVGHQQGQAANSSHHGGVGAMETRSRHSSYPAGIEEDEGVEEELSPFRGRSRSAPPNLWAAQRYGRELRRMSDEFEGSFKLRNE